jgi:hypothetical protein
MSEAENREDDRGDEMEGKDECMEKLCDRGYGYSFEGGGGGGGDGGLDSATKGDVAVEDGKPDDAVGIGERIGGVTGCDDGRG